MADEPRGLTDAAADSAGRGGIFLAAPGVRTAAFVPVTAESWDESKWGPPLHEDMRQISTCTPADGGPWAEHYLREYVTVRNWDWPAPTDSVTTQTWADVEHGFEQAATLMERLEEAQASTNPELSSLATAEIDMLRKTVLQRGRHAFWFTMPGGYVAKDAPAIGALGPVAERIASHAARAWERTLTKKPKYPRRTAHTWPTYEKTDAGLAIHEAIGLARTWDEVLARAFELAALLHVNLPLTTAVGSRTGPMRKPLPVFSVDPDNPLNFRQSGQITGVGCRIRLIRMVPTFANMAMAHMEMAAKWALRYAYPATFYRSAHGGENIRFLSAFANAERILGTKLQICEGDESNYDWHVALPHLEEADAVYQALILTGHELTRVLTERGMAANNAVIRMPGLVPGLQTNVALSVIEQLAMIVSGGKLTSVGGSINHLNLTMRIMADGLQMPIRRYEQMVADGDYPHALQSDDWLGAIPVGWELDVTQAAAVYGYELKFIPGGRAFLQTRHRAPGRFYGLASRRFMETRYPEGEDSSLAMALYALGLRFEGGLGNPFLEPAFDAAVSGTPFQGLSLHGAIERTRDPAVIAAVVEAARRPEYERTGQDLARAFLRGEIDATEYDGTEAEAFAAMLPTSTLQEPVVDASSYKNVLGTELGVLLGTSLKKMAAASRLSAMVAFDSVSGAPRDSAL